VEPAVRAVFDAYPTAVRDALIDLRRIILEAADETLGAGQVVETLKWKQPAYLPAHPRVGTTVRIDALKGPGGGYAMYVHCQSTLMDQYRLLYPDAFTFEGQRAILFAADAPPPEAPLKHCIALALSYHRRGKTAS
jgi:hypothetical protein